MAAFPLIDEYVGRHLDADLSCLQPGRVAVVESARRLQREESYGFLHALWWVWLEDGRSAVSVPPGAGPAVAAIVKDVRDREGLFDPALAERLRVIVDGCLRQHGRAATNCTRPALCFACNAALLRRHAHGDCRRLLDDSVPIAEGLWPSTHCFPDGIVYGVVADGRVVSLAYAHRSGMMEGQVADLGLETAEAYRRRGYAQTAVSAVVAAVTRKGGEALYDVSPDNLASIATARSVGFVPYGRMLALAAPADEG